MKYFKTIIFWLKILFYKFDEDEVDWLLLMIIIVIGILMVIAAYTLIIYP